MPAQTPEQVHPLFEEAFNAGDLDALMALFEPDAVFVAQPGQVLTGPDPDREGLDSCLVTGGKMRITPLGSVASPDIALVCQGGNRAGRWPAHVQRPISGVVRRGDDGGWRLSSTTPSPAR